MVKISLFLATVGSLRAWVGRNLELTAWGWRSFSISDLLSASLLSLSLSLSLYIYIYIL